MNTSSSQPFSSRIVTVSSSCSTNASAAATTVNHNNFHINGSISTGSNSSTDLNHDQIFAPNAWWRSFGNSYSNMNFTNANTTNLQQQEEIQQYANLISMPTSGNVIQDSDSCSIIDWDNFFAPSCNSHQEPKILTSIPSQQQQASSTCKITINPNCTNSFDNSSDSATANFICHNNYSTTTTSATVTNNNTSNIDGMISLLNRILIMNGVNPAASNQCQIPTISSSTYQHSNMETNPTTFVTETANFNYAPIQSFDQMQTQPACNLLNYTSIPSQSTHNTSFSSSSSSDSDSTGSQHSNNSIGNKNKIAKKRTTRPRLKFQKEADKSIKFNLITSEELAATLQFHETLMPTSGGKRNRGRPKKSESSPQKPKAEQSTNIEFMVNCYDQCSKIFK